MKTIVEFCITNKIINPIFIKDWEGETRKYYIIKNGELVKKEYKYFYFPVYSGKIDDIDTIDIRKLDNGRYDLKLASNPTLRQLTLEEAESKLLEFVKENECVRIEDLVG